MIGSALARRATGTFSRIAELSLLLLVTRSAPRKSTASAICRADREPAPSVSSDAVRLATPNLPAGSSPVPLSTTRFTWTTGTSCRSTIQTGRPFDSMRFWMAGSFSTGGGPDCGGLLRSGAWAPVMRASREPENART